MKGKRKEEGHPLYICSELVDISSDITHTRNYLISNKNVYRVVGLFFSGDCIGGRHNSTSRFSDIMGALSFQ
jgi:hypothetical protein